MIGVIIMGVMFIGFMEHIVGRNRPRPPKHIREAIERNRWTP